MASTPLVSALPTRSGGTVLECAPLLDRCTSQLFRTNAFRVLGLPIDVGIREITRHADKLQKMAEFGGASGLEKHHVQALVPPPTAEEIREAAQRLKDPEQRLIDEFFLVLAHDSRGYR